MDTSAKVLIVVMAALNALGLIFAVYLKSYVGEKAKHFATKEDLQQLVREVRERAVASKEGEITGIQNKLDVVVEQNERLVRSSEVIRTDLSEKSSSRQRLRDMRREVAFKLVNLLGSLEQTMIAAMTEAELLAPLETVQENDLKKINAIYARYRSLMHRMGQVRGQISLVFDDPARDLFHAMSASASAFIDSTNRFKYRPDTIEALMELYNERSVKLRILIKHQLLL